MTAGSTVSVMGVRWLCDSIVGYQFRTDGSWQHCVNDGGDIVWQYCWVSVSNWWKLAALCQWMGCDDCVTVLSSNSVTLMTAGSTVSVMGVRWLCNSTVEYQCRTDGSWQHCVGDWVRWLCDSTVSISVTLMAAVSTVSIMEVRWLCDSAVSISFTLMAAVSTVSIMKVR